MKYIMLLLSALAGIMLSHAASVSDGLVDPMAKYTIVDLEWIVPISPDRNDTVVGTIQDVAKHLEIVDPEGFAAVNETINKAAAARLTNHPTISYSSRDEPGMYNATDYVCNYYKEYASGIDIRDGIEYLRTVKGTPGAGPCADCCGRVSCSYDSAIWWCNDGPVDLVLDSYGRIADGAEYLMNDCTFIQNDGSIGDFNGIIFFESKWDVIVRGNNC